jgi:hypothetical protein
MAMIDLDAAAIRAHPHNEAHRRKWLAAVAYLRQGRGWVADHGVVGFRLPVAADPEAPKHADKVRPIVFNRMKP